MIANASAGQHFGLGITIGVLIGFALGSFVALLVGDEVVQATQSLSRRLFGGSDDPNFELLAQ